MLNIDSVYSYLVMQACAKFPCILILGQIQIQKKYLVFFHIFPLHNSRWDRIKFDSAQIRVNFQNFILDLDLA